MKQFKEGSLTQEEAKLQMEDLVVDFPTEKFNRLIE